MQENTNKVILINSVINYAKMGINTVLALLTTRFALQALGVDDFGLFSLLGSIITFINIFNIIMLSTCNRFMSVAIGKGDIYLINKQFNINLVIFIGVAILLAIIALPIGEWYIGKYIQYNGPIENANIVFVISIVGAVISTISTPYNGLLIAKERFFVFSLVEVLTHLIKFIIAFILIDNFENKLLIYSVVMAVTTALPTFVYWAYCHVQLTDYVRWNFVKDKPAYKEIFFFSGWVSYGAFASIARNQGAALLVNAFFNTAMNTALGIANSLISYVQMFANNLTTPMQPQITKSYVSGNIERTKELLVMSTKFSFLLMLVISTPFFVGGEWLLSLWLGDVPAYVLSFTVLLIIDSLVTSFNSGLSVLLFASGKIALYQILINTLRLLSIGCGYIVLKAGYSPESLFATYIAFSVIIIIATQYCLLRTLHFDSKFLFAQSYRPSIIVSVLLVPACIIDYPVHSLFKIGITLLYLLGLIYVFSLSKKEKTFILNSMRKWKR